MHTTIKTEFKSEMMQLHEVGLWLADLVFPPDSINQNVYIGNDFNTPRKFQAIVSYEIEHA